MAFDVIIISITNIKLAIKFPDVDRESEKVEKVRKKVFSFSYNFLLTNISSRILLPVHFLMKIEGNEKCHACPRVLASVVFHYSGIPLLFRHSAVVP